MKNEWTIEIGFTNGAVQKIGCTSREDAEPIKAHWLKKAIDCPNQSIKYVHCTAGDTIGNVPDRAKQKVAAQMIRKMFANF